MRRRLTIAIVGTVVVSLVVAGLGTILLASLNNRLAAEDELRDQAEALASIFEEVQRTVGPYIWVISGHPAPCTFTSAIRG